MNGKSERKLMYQAYIMKHFTIIQDIVAKIKKCQRIFGVDIIFEKKNLEKKSNTVIMKFLLWLWGAKLKSATNIIYETRTKQKSNYVGHSLLFYLYTYIYSIYGKSSSLLFEITEKKYNDRCVYI